MKRLALMAPRWVCALLLLALLLTTSAFAQEPLPDSMPPDAMLPASTPALVPLAGIAAIDAGGNHTCALTNGGGVKCWGQDEDGQLGNGPLVNPELTPVDVSSLTSGVQAIAAGLFFTCALTSTGGVVCWGQDGNGQVGDGANADDKTIPVSVSGLTTGVQAITAGLYHACALTSTGGVKCWGQDSFGQLGDGVDDNADEPTPVNVPGLASGVQAIAAGGYHTCALTDVGGVKCWGHDSYGQLGDGADGNADEPNPVNVAGLSIDVLAIAAGTYHTCAVLTDGALRCWGWDSYGQIGDGMPAASQTTPVAVAALPSGVQAIDLGGSQTCALTIGGGVKCWGNDEVGQVGDGPDGAAKMTPVDVSGLSGGVRAIAAGNGHSCAVTTGGGVKCWGHDVYGQVGDGPYNLNKHIPVDVVVEKTCFQLTLSGSGGPAPTPSLSPSAGCPAGHYLAGTQMSLYAAPAAGQRVAAWGAPAAGLPGATVASLTMPAADKTVMVTYGACHTLTRTASAGGSAPVASPTNSLGCAANTYGAGESITLGALPNAGQRVKAWAGTTTTPAAASQINFLTMPNAARSVSVTYEACFALSTSIVGSGAALAVGPAATDGCLTGGFVAGQMVTLQAAPAAGWRVAGWTGTQNNGSTANTNTLLMPAGNAAASVRYEQIPDTPATARVLLPLVKR